MNTLLKAVLLGCLIVPFMSCGDAGSTGSAAGRMTGLWEIPVGELLVATLTQTGDTISGFGHVADPSVNCWDEYDRLAITGTVRNSAVELTVGSGYQTIRITGELSADGSVLHNVQATAPSCTPDGGPWGGEGTGAKIVPLDGTFDIRTVTGTGEPIGAITATLKQGTELGAIGQLAVTGTATLGAEWGCDLGVLTADSDFWLHGGRLQGHFRAATGDLLYIEASRIHPGAAAFSGGFSGPVSCREGGNLTITKHGNPPPAVSEYFAYVTNSGMRIVSAYSIDPGTGTLTEIADSPYSAADSPCSVAVEPSGKFVYVANALTDNISGYVIDSATGALTWIAGSPFVSGVRPVSIAVEPSGKFVYVTNEFSHNISAYAVNPVTGALTEVAGSPFASGVEPCSVALDPTGKFAYAANASSQNVSAYAINPATGALTEVAGSPFVSGVTPLSVALDPTGKFAYVVNHDSHNISAYAINSATGALNETPGSPFAAGGYPISAALNPTGKFAYVANYGSDSVSAYSINSDTGALTEIAGSPYASWGQPASVSVDPTGAFVYVTNSWANYISAFAIDSATGGLTPITASPFFTGSKPRAIVTCRVRR